MLRITETRKLTLPRLNSKDTTLDMANAELVREFLNAFPVPRDQQSTAHINFKSNFHVLLHVMKVPK